MGWMIQGFIVAQATDFFVSPKCQDHQWGTTDQFSVECQGFFRSNAGWT